MCLFIYGEVGFGLCDPWPIINQLYLFTVTKEMHIHSSFHVVLCLPFHVHHHGKTISNMFFFICITSKLWKKKISFQSSKKILCFTQLSVIPKPGNLFLLEWKPNTMPSYCEIISYNSSLDGTSDAISLSTLHTKSTFYSFFFIVFFVI